MVLNQISVFIPANMGFRTHQDLFARVGHELVARGHEVRDKMKILEVFEFDVQQSNDNFLSVVVIIRVLVTEYLV